MMGSPDAAPFVKKALKESFSYQYPLKSKYDEDSKSETKPLIEGKKSIIPNLPLKRPDDGKDNTSNAKQGKVAELRQELTMAGKKDKNHSAKKVALKRIVANMTMSNNDMVALFPDIVQCMHIPSLDVKKM